MELPLVCSSGNCEQRAVIRFLTAENISSKQIHERLKNVYGDAAMPDRTIRSWMEKFKGGRTNVHDEGRSGRPNDAVNDETTSAVLLLLERDRRYTIEDLKQLLEDEFLIDVSPASIYRTLEEAGFSKVCARWVPRLLSDEHRTKRLDSALTFLTAYERDTSILHRIVTGDETCVHYVTPTTKTATMIWKRKEEPTPKKAKQEKSANKLMVIVFWDHRGVILTEFMERGHTINSDSYCKTLTSLRKAIKSKRPGLLSRKPILLHDNARPHSSRQSAEHLDSFKWEIFNHPPYSPDLAPSDFHLFPKLKGFLGGVRFNNDEELKAGVTTWLKNLDKTEYALGIEKLVTRYDKCLNVRGDYVEK